MTSPCSLTEKILATTYTLKVQNGAREAAQIIDILSTEEEKFRSVTIINPVEGHHHAYGSCSRLVLSCDKNESMDLAGGAPTEEDDPISGSDLDAEAYESSTTVIGQESSTTTETRRAAEESVNGCITTAARKNLALMLAVMPQIIETRETPAEEESRPALAVANTPTQKVAAKVQGQGAKVDTQEPAKKEPEAKVKRKGAKKVEAKEITAKKKETASRTTAALAASAACSSPLPALRICEGSSSSSSTSSNSKKIRTMNTTIIKNIKINQDERPTSAQGRKRSVETEETELEKKERKKRRDERKKEAEEDRKAGKFAEIETELSAEKVVIDEAVQQAQEELAKEEFEQSAIQPILQRISRLLKQKTFKREQAKREIHKIENSEQSNVPVVNLNSTTEDLNESDSTQPSSARHESSRKKKKD